MTAASKQLQISHATGFMRYREYYARLSSDLLVHDNPRILVFGCSNGAELKTVHHFWPQARIFGCDINEDILEIAREQAPFAEVFHSDHGRIRELGPFDLVAVNSVLCRHPFPKSGLANDLPFATFEDYIVMLLSVLRRGGYLFAYNTNHFLDDLEISSHLQPILFAAEWSGSVVPKVDRDGTVVAHSTVLDHRLHRYVVSNGIDPINRMRTALYRFGRGPAITLSDRIALPVSTTLTSRGELPTPSHPKAFEPCFIDTSIATGTLRTTYLHDPVESCWVLHGMHLVHEGA